MLRMTTSSSTKQKTLLATRTLCHIWSRSRCSDTSKVMSLWMCDTTNSMYLHVLADNVTAVCRVRRTSVLERMHFHSRHRGVRIPCQLGILQGNCDSILMHMLRGSKWKFSRSIALFHFILRAWKALYSERVGLAGAKFVQ